ncbi:MAG: hypothetical protein Q9182_007485 [Xanthomendoza sp. 2 TL-2023]
MNKISAHPPLFSNACAILHLDPVRPLLPDPTGAASTPTHLHAWQVQFLAWAQNLEPMLGGFLLADEMGSGKTLSTLAHIVLHAIAHGWPAPTKGTDKSPSPTGQMSSPRLSDNAPNLDSDTEDAIPESGLGISQDTLDSIKNPTVKEKVVQAQRKAQRLARRRYKASLILCPSQAAVVWENEIEKFLPMLRHPYNIAELSEAHLTLPANIKGLLNHLRDIPDDPSALVHVILCTYEIWSARATYSELLSGQARQKPDAEGEDDDDGLGPEDEEESFKHVLHLCGGVFGRVVCDEAQRVKHPSTLTHRSVKELEALFMVQLTATPIINRPVDLFGLLRLFWKASWAESPDERGKDAVQVQGYITVPDEQSYYAAMAVLSEPAMLTEVNFLAFRHLLSPEAFRQYTAPTDDRQMDSRLANTIIPPILSIIQLRRTPSNIIRVLHPAWKVDDR